MSKVRTALVLFFLLSANSIAHFLPFERASISNDDYAILARASSLSIPQIISLTPQQPDRPFAFIFLMLQEKLSDGNPKVGLLVMVFCTSIVLLAVFLLLKLLLNNTPQAIMGALLFSILPHKLEVYHIPVYAIIDIANFFYILSFIFAIKYLKSAKKSHLVVSFASYIFAMFTYEPGFFLPLIISAYFFLYKREKFKVSLSYAIPAAFYIAFKLTNAFGMGEASPLQRHMPGVAMLPTNLLDVFHHYFGRYMARNALYGVYKFFAIEKLSLTLIILFDSALLIAVSLLLKKIREGRLEQKVVRIAICMFFVFLLPILLNTSGGVGGRHLVLPSIGIVLFLLWFLDRIKGYRRQAGVMLVAFLLIICQGNAWAQVIACRINASIYDTLKEHKTELLEADTIVIDTRSFADNIPFAWISRDYNVLNTYYGAQALEGWGLMSMLRLVLKNVEKPAYISVETPKTIGNDLLEIAVVKPLGYCSFAKEKKIIQRANTMIINFKSVYAENFNNGLRLKK